MHLDHLRYRRYVDAFVDGELDGALRDRVAHHLAECPMCHDAALVTVRVKGSLAAQGGFAMRATERVRHWLGRSSL